MGRLTIDEVIEHCKRHTERTEKHYLKEDLENYPVEGNDFIKRYLEHRQVAEWLMELKAYKDLEEQGMLWKLPCKHDEIVWVAQKGFKTHKTIYASPSAMLDDLERGFGIGYTKEEAEAALKEMEK